MGKKNSPEVRSVILGLIRALLGIWLTLTIDDIFLERMSGAMTNAVYSVNVHYGSREKLIGLEPSRMLLRIYGQGIDWMFSRRREFECTRRLAEAGIAPRWLGTFGNGRFEEFVRNIPVTSDMVREGEISALIARKLFHLHYKSGMAGDEIDLDDRQRSLVWKRLATWRQKALEALKAMSIEDHPLANSPYLVRLLQLGLGEADFERDIDNCKAACREVSSPIVLCHNDLHQGNVMLRKEDRSVILIDFEYAALSPRGFDLANHFCEWASDYTADTPESLDYAHRYPSAEEQMIFIRAYCDEALSEDVECEPEMLFLEAQAYVPVSHLLWAHWGIIQATKSFISFDYLRFAYERLDQFQRILR